MRKQIPSSKLQAPEKHQASNSKQPGARHLKLGVGSCSGGWSLELGCFILLAAIFLAMALPASPQQTETQFLSGHGKDDAVPWKFFCTSGAHSGFWTSLPVPSQWDVKGFGTLNYHKDLTNAWNERGLYEHDFSVPANWAGQRIFLVFDGVMTDTDARLNGQSVGPVHQGGFYH